MTLGPLLAPPSISAHTGFLLAEDDALKQRLTGIQVPRSLQDETPQEVGVWFRWPTGERQIRYPFITIDALSAEPDFPLFHSNHYPPHQTYRPSISPVLPPIDDPRNKQYKLLNYLPFKVMYQVAHYARSNLHDRYLRSIFQTDVFPVRPFWLACPADNTWRRTEQVGYAAADESETNESGTKRVFRKIYTIQMYAEIPQERLADAAYYKVFRVHITGRSRDALDEYFHFSHEGEEVPTPT